MVRACRWQKSAGSVGSATGSGREVLLVCFTLSSASLPVMYCRTGVAGSTAGVEREEVDGDAAVEDGSWWSCRTYQR